MAGRLPPGPRAPWPVQLARYALACARRYGDAFTLRFGPIGKRLVLLSHPAAMKEIFTAPHRSLEAGEANRPLIIDVFGRQLGARSRRRSAPPPAPDALAAVSRREDAPLRRHHARCRRRDDPANGLRRPGRSGARAAAGDSGQLGTQALLCMIV